jgi:hypothetical protein
MLSPATRARIYRFGNFAMAQPQQTLTLDGEGVQLGGRASGLPVLAASLLVWPNASGSTPWLPIDAARDRATRAREMLDEAGWPGGYNEDRLHRLPPILIRRGAEHFARRLLAAERDVSAMRTIGSIHDFVWLLALLEARCTNPAHAPMTMHLLTANLFTLADTASLPELLISRTISSDLSGFLETDRPANSHSTRSTPQTKGTDQ